MSPTVRRGALCAVALACLTASPRPVVADARYDDAFRGALALEARGDVDGAARLLEPLVTVYPDDYFLFLHLGWLHFQARSYARSETRYDRALVLSHGGAEAWLGLGWVYLRTDRPEDAAAAFDRVLAQRPDDASALEGRALAREAARPLLVYLEGYTTFHHYPGHPLKEWGIGVAPSVDARIARRVLVGATYRLTEYALRTASGGAGPGPGGGSAQELRFQNEAYARLGLAWPLFGVMAHFAWVQDDTSLSGETWVGGLSLRVSPFGDIVGEASASVVDDATVLRGSLAWALPIGDRLTAQPGFSIQRSADAEVLADGSLLLRTRTEPMSFWVGGRYGREERPAYLALSLVYNTIDRMLGGAFAGLRYDAPSGFHAYATYEWQALETPVATGFDRSNAHFLTLGLGGTP